MGSHDQVYLQTSKGIYETGEDLWFKGYVLDSRFLQPSDNSQILYVQLTKKSENKPLWQEKYEIKKGFVEGHLLVNDTLPPGEYLLSGFTKYALFHKEIDHHSVRKVEIVEKIEDFKKIPLKKTDSLKTFALLPEGGHMVYGLTNRVAFKASNDQGIPANVAGLLLEDESPLVRFKSEHDGMGSFDFKPQIGKKYRIKLEGLNKDSLIDLPNIMTQGMLLRVEGEKEGNLMAKVKGTEAFHGSKVFVRLQQRGVVYGMAEAILRDSITIAFPNKELPQGIFEVTLFDAELRPVAERLFYSNWRKKLHIKAKISYDDSYLKVRGKATLKIKASDVDGNPAIAHLGVSVFDQAYVNKGDSKNILAHYHLSTQLKGKIHNPSFYFDQESVERERAMDLLLMTQGWRKYLWNEKVLNQWISTGRSSLNAVHGTVTSRKSAKKDISSPVVMAYNPSGGGGTDLIMPDSLGTFQITSNHLKVGEGGYTYLRLMSDKSKYTMQVKDNSFETLERLTKGRLAYPEYKYVATGDVDVTPMPNEDGMIQLNEVELESKRKTIYREKYFGKLDSIAKLVNTDYVCKHNILNCEYHVFDKENRRPVEGEIYFYTEVYKENIGWVKGHPKLVPGNTVFRNPPLPPYRATTYSDEDLLKMFNMVRIKGYYGQREFYQPQHDVEENPFPDYRNTLLWAPTVITNASGEASLDFYCSDLNTSFLGVIEGVDGNGLLGAHQIEFTVEK